MKYGHAAVEPVARVLFLTVGKSSRLVALALLGLHTAGLAKVYKKLFSIIAQPGSKLFKIKGLSIIK